VTGLPPLPPRAVWVLRWSAFLLVSWIVLRPALTITISGDDFLNPFFVFDDYGPSPFGMFRSVSRDLTRAGHFNYVGQNVGAIVYVAWAYLIGWGVRYSLIYATTKFVVLVLTAVVAARLCRTLVALLGRETSVWWSRVLVAAALFLTLQIHVPWSSDPVTSFPLSGYLAAAIGIAALDAAIRTLGRVDRRSLVVAAIGLMLAILYYEINVVMVVALVPVLGLLLLRGHADTTPARPARRALLVRAVLLVGPATVMTMVLQRIAATSNRGYTGTDVAVGNGTLGVLVRATLGSLPVSAWRVAHDYLGRPFRSSLGSAVTVVVVVAVGVTLSLVARSRSGRSFVAVRVPDADLEPAGTTPSPAPSPAPSATGPWRTVAIVVAVPLIVWLGATAVQATTAKVRAETLRIGYVYNYYAYGSVAVVLLGLVVAFALVPHLPARVRRAWPIALVVALLFASVQTVINGDVQREFDARLPQNGAVLAAIADQPDEATRCATLAAWSGLPFWLDYYRADFIDGVDATYRYFHHEPFCSQLPR